MPSVKDVQPSQPGQDRLRLPSGVWCVTPRFSGIPGSSFPEELMPNAGMLQGCSSTSGPT